MDIILFPNENGFELKLVINNEDNLNEVYLSDIKEFELLKILIAQLKGKVSVYSDSDKTLTYSIHI